MKEVDLDLLVETPDRLLTQVFPEYTREELRWLKRSSLLKETVMRKKVVVPSDDLKAENAILRQKLAEVSNRMSRPMSVTSYKASPSAKPKKHIIIPDTQVRAGVPTDHLSWIGQYVQDKKPYTLVVLGDWWDMPSLSMHDALGSKAMEGARYEFDIESGNDAMDQFLKPIKNRPPQMVFLMGNHEDRVTRAAFRDPRLENTVSLKDMNCYQNFQVHDFLDVVDIDGIWYSHYLYNPLTGRPYGGTMDNRLNKIGHSFTQGHEQTFRFANRYLGDGTQQNGLVVGACYLHDERYKGPQGNFHWRGIIVKHQVNDGSYDLMQVNLDFLCRKYEGMSLREFMRKKYGKTNLSLTRGG